MGIVGGGKQGVGIASAREREISGNDHLAIGTGIYGDLRRGECLQPTALEPIIVLERVVMMIRVEIKGHAEHEEQEPVPAVAVPPEPAPQWQETNHRDEIPRREHHKGA